jgi:hypothetical protein
MWALSEKPNKKAGTTADPTCKAIGNPQGQAQWQRASKSFTYTPLGLK